MEGDSGKAMPDFLNGRDAVVWARTYSAEDPERCNCETLEKALGMVPGAKRMVRICSRRQGYSFAPAVRPGLRRSAVTALQLHRCGGD